MSLMGIDIGTTGCKAAAFRADGALLALAYREYDIQRPAPGSAELDPIQVWALIKECIREVTAATGADPVSALTVSSLGEAVVPVSAARRILGPSLLNFDERGAEFLPELSGQLPAELLYTLNGNTLGNHYTLTKLLWTRTHCPELWDATYRFLHWAPFAAFMLGGEAGVDYSLANRTLLFDLDAKAWSAELAQRAGVDTGKLPTPIPTGAIVGTVSTALADELGLRHDVAIVLGAHDQCANAVGCGAVEPGIAMLGMGTYFCIAPIFTQRPRAARMMPFGLNTEHAATPGQYISFIYNHGGSMLKWYRDTFAATEAASARAEGRDLYPALLAETPDGPSSVFVLPHFAATGPPEFIEDSAGVILGLKLDTTRGDILKGILEGAAFYLLEALEPAIAAGVPVDEFRAAGGGSRGSVWLQICADILGRPLRKMACEEAGALGGAILAGVATGVYASIAEGARIAAHIAGEILPDSSNVHEYGARFERYRRIWPCLKGLIQSQNSIIE